MTKLHKDVESGLRDHSIIAVGTLMNYLFGNDWKSDHSLSNTPERFLKYLEEFRQDHDKLLEDIRKKVFNLNDDEDPTMVVQQNIPYRMVCEHHLLPATGHAILGYIPNKKVIGISKLSRIVDLVGTERPSLQEKTTDRIVKLLQDMLDPQGVICITTATHGCMSCRGVKNPDTLTSCSAVTGVFRDPTEGARTEFYNIINR